MLSKKLSAAVLMAGLVGFSGAAFAGDTITLNPSATNSGAGAIYAGQGAFTVDNILAGMKSVLDISSISGAGTWSESGSMIFTQGTLNNLGVTSGFNRYFNGGTTGFYDVYGVFTGGGSGFWSGSSFIVSSVSSFSIKLYASPAGSPAEVLGNASSGTDATGGVTAGANDKFLGTANFLVQTGLTSATLGANNTATTGLVADFAFTPNPTYSSGVGYFFQAPSPFNITIGGSGSSNSGESTYAVTGSSVRVTTGATKMGTANLSFQHVVPEPGALSLAGLALLGLGVAGRRRKAKTAA